MVKLHFEPWRRKKHSVFEVFRDVVYRCPSYKILTKVRIVKIASLEAIGLLRDQGCPNTPAWCLQSTAADLQADASAADLSRAR